jgi:quercetin dioxygenase-like cupin family protein
MKLSSSRVGPGTTATLAFLVGACTATALGAHGAESPAAGEPARVPAQVAHGDAVEVRASPPGTARIRMLLKGAHAFVGQLELAPRARVPEHRDATEEYIVVVQGGGTMEIDGQVHHLTAGDAVLMPAGSLVSFVNDDAPTVAVQVFAPPGPDAKYDGWSRTSAQ